ncbi:MAG: hypothetical protein VXZ18_18900 [Pseudomonadota bacterium]|nr:hypothetical protein [Pseudomonadota bacterium]MEC8582806.1 hypothetical protein [Pseudomonadota bacterium]
MLLTIVLSVLAGAAVVPVQPRVTEFLHRYLDEERLPDEAGRRLIPFCVTMGLAALILSFLTMPTPMILMLICGLIGYFQAPIRDALVSRRR